MKMNIINKKEVIKMPGGDRRGPQGLGPMTGRGTGYCAGYPVPGHMNPVGGRGFGYGYGRGRGRGQGRGRGRSFGRGAFAYQEAYGYPYPEYPGGNEMPAKDEAAMLKEEARVMQDEIKSINARIKELEGKARPEKK